MDANSGLIVEYVPMFYYYQYLPWETIFNLPAQDIAVLNWSWMAYENTKEDGFRA